MKSATTTLLLAAVGLTGLVIAGGALLASQRQEQQVCFAAVEATVSASPNDVGESMRASLNACRAIPAWLEAVNAVPDAMVWESDERAIEVVCWAWPGTVTCRTGESR